MWEALVDFFMGDTVRLDRSEYMYHFPHILTIVLVALISTIAVVWGRKKATQKQKNGFLWVMFGILLAFEIVSMSLELIEGGNYMVFIPMHFSTIMLWMVVLVIGTKNQHLLNIAGMGGILAGLGFFANPVVGFNAEVLKFGNYYSIITHGIVMISGIFITACGYAKYKWKYSWSMALFIVFVYVYSFFQNFVWFEDTNYLYYSINVLPIPYGWFLTLYIMLLLTYFTSFYLIYEKSHKPKNR